MFCVEIEHSGATIRPSHLQLVCIVPLYNYLITGCACRVFDPSSPPGTVGLHHGTQYTDTFMGLILGNLLHEQGTLLDLK